MASMGQVFDAQPAPPTIECRYCNGQATCRSSVHGFWYKCELCDASVGCHRGTDKPLGYLATPELRQWRMKAHAAFDRIWKTRRISRSGAYRWLATELGVTSSQCHMAMFEVETCVRVIELSTGFIDLPRAATKFLSDSEDDDREDEDDFMFAECGSFGDNHSWY